MLAKRLIFTSVILSLVVALITGCQADNAQTPAQIPDSQTVTEQTLTKTGYTFDNDGFLRSIEQCDYDAVELFLTAGFSPNKGDEKWPMQTEYWPLLTAVFGGDNSIVSLLIDHGAEVDASDMYRHTILSPAAAKGYKDIVVTLIENGADVNGADGGPLANAAREGHLEIAEILLLNGADPNMGTETVPIASAAREGRLEMLTLLLEHGADINGTANPDCDDNTALSTAAYRGYAHIVDYLIKEGANIDKSNSMGFTALMNAVLQNHLEVMELLLENGADVHLQNNYGKTALTLAESAGHTEIIELLKSFGAK